MLPLADVKVVEFCQVLAGPFCGCLLADMGADVIKIEPPEGDVMRSWAPLIGEESQYFASLNRNKRSIALDLKTSAGLCVARELALGANIMIENFRPGVLKRLGLGYDELSRQHPALVYCSISAYGQTGPRVAEGGFDMTVQAMSGVMSVTGENNGPPVKCGIPIADSTAGLYAAFSVVAALRRAELSGRGEYIDVAMLGAMLGIAHLQTSELFALNRDPVRLGSAHPMNAPYAVFRCRDGYVALAAGNDKLWKSTCEVLGRADWVADERFATPALRGVNQRLLTELLESELIRKDAVKVLQQFNSRGIPCAPLNTYSQIIADAQVQHMGWVAPTSLADGRQSRSIISPQRLSGENLKIYRPPPALGAHNEEILAALSSRKARALRPDRFRSFIANFTGLVEASREEEKTLLQSGSALLGELIRYDDWLPAAVAVAHPKHYRQYLLHCDPLERFSVVSFVWGPGQRTPIHDHTIWGLIGVLRGAELCRAFRKHPSGSLIGQAEQRFVHGHVECISPRTGDIHEVANAYTDRPSISIHVYGANIGAVNRHSYELDGSVHSFISGYSNAQIPNFWAP